jgi:septal ring factor EnvC (AmiA/AmiB activator)
VSDGEPELTLPEASALPGQLTITETEATNSPWRRRLLLGGIALAFVLLVAAGASAGYLAWTNKVRADDWESLAAQLELNIAELEDNLDVRTEELNERTEDLNQMAAKVTAAEQLIERSEADVKRLERRQRQLANEKAQVEDARAALALETETIADVASGQIDCRRGLEELLFYVANQDYFAANAILRRVRADCNTADAALDAYLARYG